MRKTIWISMLSVALLGGAACKRKNDSDRAMDHVPASAAKVQDDVTAPQTDVSQSRERFTADAKQRLAKLDDELHQIEQSSDVAAKDMAAALRARRDQLAARIDTADNQAQARWDGFKKEVDDSFDKLENDASDALHK